MLLERSDSPRTAKLSPLRTRSGTCSWAAKVRQGPLAISSWMGECSCDGSVIFHCNYVLPALTSISRAVPLLIMRHSSIGSALTPLARTRSQLSKSCLTGAILRLLFHLDIISQLLHSAHTPMQTLAMHSTRQVSMRSTSNFVSPLSCTRKIFGP